MLYTMGDASVGFGALLPSLPCLLRIMSRDSSRTTPLADHKYHKPCFGQGVNHGVLTQQSTQLWSAAD
eukprot:4996237-Amphidinium_carterae.1